MRRRALAWTVCLAVSSIAALGYGADAPIDRTGLARGPHATLHALFEVTIFAIDVLTVDVTVDPETQQAIDTIVRAKKVRSRATDAEIARKVIDAKQALVEARFLRDVDLDDFLEEAGNQLELATRASLITNEEREGAHKRLRRLLTPIVLRGFEEGDRLSYRVRPGVLRMVLQSAKGKTLVDARIAEPRAGPIVLASYLAPGHDLRGLLIGSLFP